MFPLAVLGAATFACLSPQANGGEAVLDEKTPCRVFWRLSPVLVGAKGEYAPNARTRDALSPAPPADWMAPGFNDQDWGFRDSVYPGCGHELGQDPWVLAGIYLRRRFAVADPAKVKGLTLRVVFRGGAVVYVNGQEVARTHLPAGPLGPEALAEDYPLEAFMAPDGAAPLPPSPMPAKEHDERYRLRLRAMDVAIPSKLLVKGPNVLAIEIRRAPYRPELVKFHWHGVLARTLWATAGLHAAKLAAESPEGFVAGSVPTVGVQVWNAPPMAMVGPDVASGDPFDALRPVALSAPRNGVASGQVVVSAAEPLKGLAAKVSDLRSATGAPMPASAIAVRHAWQAKGEQPNPFDVLSTRPSDGQPIQPVWLTVKVPADAKPGNYTGTLTLSGPLATTTVPVELMVYDWTLPAPAAWTTWVALLESPETLALHYRVPMWSDSHFGLVDQSLALLGQLGSRVAIVSALANTWLGSEPMVVFRRETGKLVPDFRFVERYLKLYAKHASEPQVLWLQVWNVTLEDSRRRAAAIPVLELQGDKVVPAEAPMFGDDGSEPLWSSVLAGARRAMKGLGWDERRLMLGTQQDAWPHKATIAFFRKIAPDVPWVIYSHGTGSSELQRGFVINPDQGGGHSQPGWLHPRGYPNCTNHRNSLVAASYLPNYRQAGLDALTHGFSGTGGYGFDFWPLPDANGRTQAKLLAHDTGGNWYRLFRGAVRTLTAPGPDGPLPTVRYEMLREGLQEAEALAFIERAAATGRLPAELDARAKAVRAALVGKIRAMLLSQRSCAFGWQTEKDALYRCAAEIAKALAVRR
jgi:hypothetical protein